MSQLFSKSIIKSAISWLQWLSLEKEISIISELYNDFRKGNMKDETRYEQRFNNLFFGELLGYEENIHRHPKANTPVWAKTADVGLWFFLNWWYEYEWVKVVVELKWSDCLLDKKQTGAYAGQTPVDQGFGYKTSFKDCPWLIVSNFWSIRLYRDNKQDYEIRTIEQLADPANDYYNLKSLLVILGKKYLISESGKSATETRLSEVRIIQEQITKKFYQQYKALRFELINDIRHHNPDISVEIIVEKSQKIIDRIIFIHFCEDKGLLPHGKLKQVINYGEQALSSTFQTLSNFFEAVNSGSNKLDIPNGYNGGLFHSDPELNNLKVSDSICSKFVNLGDFNFDDELSVNILWHIFEQSISDIEQLKIDLLWQETETDHLVEKKESKRKKDGIFYTPEYIVDYIVQNSLMTYLEEKENECLKKYPKDELKAYQAYQQILQNVKVLDPACGSGAFLVKVFDYLYGENKRIWQIIGGLFDDSQIYKDILRNNIYGVDLNPESVEITKLSLWLKSAQKGKKLNNLDDNIKCGNSLIDDPAVAGERAFDWYQEFPSILSGLTPTSKYNTHTNTKTWKESYTWYDHEMFGFDVIVGNPPYVSSYWRQAQKFDKKEIKYYIQNYDTFESVKNRGNISFNTIMWFMEKTIKLMKNGWYNWFIMDQAILGVDVYEYCRKYVLDNSQLIEIDSDILFPWVVAETCIIFLKKEKSQNYSVWIKSKDLDNPLQAESIKSIIKDWYKITLSKNSSLISKIEKETQNLNNIVETFTWMQIIPEYFLSDDDNIIKKDKWHKAVFSKNISRYWIERPLEWQPWKYITYDNALQDEVRSILTEKLKKWEKCRDPQSLSIGSPEKEYRFWIPKIIISQTVSNAWWKVRLQACLDNIEWYYWNVSIHLLKHNDESFLKILMCIINSSLITYYAKENKLIMWAEEWSKKTPQIRKWDIDKLPIKDIPLSAQQPFIEKADLMLSLNQQLHDRSDTVLRFLTQKYAITKPSTKLQKRRELDFSWLLKELKSVKISLADQADLMDYFESKKKEILNLKSQINTTDKQINDMVFDLYGLTEEERRVVLDS